MHQHNVLVQISVIKTSSRGALGERGERMFQGSWSRMKKGLKGVQSTGGFRTIIRGGQRHVLASLDADTSFLGQMVLVNTCQHLKSIEPAFITFNLVSALNQVSFQIPNHRHQYGPTMCVRWCVYRNRRRTRTQDIILFLFSAATQAQRLSYSATVPVTENNHL